MVVVVRDAGVVLFCHLSLLTEEGGGGGGGER